MMIDSFNHSLLLHSVKNLFILQSICHDNFWLFLTHPESQSLPSVLLTPPDPLYPLLQVYEVVASDRGQPPRHTSAYLVVSVTDVNDCPPSLVFYSRWPRDARDALLLDENVPNATFLGSLNAHDDDSLVNNVVTCEMTSGREFFTLAELSGSFILSVITQVSQTLR